MGQPAARVGDMHLCPMVTPGVPPVPHVGGPILPPGGINVLIGGLPAATLGGMCTCVGPPDVIVRGSFTVLIGGRPAARMGDNTAHGGVITLGCPTVLIGDFGMGEPGVVTPEMLNNMFMAALDIAGVTQDTSRMQVLDGMDGQTPAGLFSWIGGIASAIRNFFSPPPPALPPVVVPPVAPPAPPANAADLAALQAIVDGVNPQGSVINCGNIIDAAVARLRGTDPNAAAPTTRDGSFPDIDTRFNTTVQWGQTFDQAFAAVGQGGPGTTAIIGIAYPNNGGSHVVTMTNQNGTVAIIEGQDWGAAGSREVITDPQRARDRYGAGSDVGVGIIPAPPAPVPAVP